MAQPPAVAEAQPLSRPFRAAKLMGGVLATYEGIQAGIGASAALTAGLVLVALGLRQAGLRCGYPMLRGQGGRPQRSR